MTNELPSDEEIYKIGSRLKLARIESGISPAEISRRINYSPASVSRLERNLFSEPSAAERATLLYEQALGIKPGTIMTDSCELPTNEPNFSSKLEEILTQASLTSEKREEIEGYILELTQKTVDFLFPKK